MIKAVFFDLDGTLLPMDQDEFVNGYFTFLCRKMAPYGYEPEALVKAIWGGTAAMVRNDGSCMNEEAFWKYFLGLYGESARPHVPLFEEFYAVDFQKARQFCGFDPLAKETVDLVRNSGLRVILATNPLFPYYATYSRVRWAGLQPEDFEFITTYENSSTCKPNPDYFREILAHTGLQPGEVLMVGNDTGEDMIAETLGMRVFLLTDCLINKSEADIGQWPHGGFKELQEFIKTLNESKTDR